MGFFEKNRPAQNSSITTVQLNKTNQAPVAQQKKEAKNYET